MTNLYCVEKDFGSKLIEIIDIENVPLIKLSNGLDGFTNFIRDIDHQKIFVKYEDLNNWLHSLFSAKAINAKEELIWKLNYLKGKVEESSINGVEIQNLLCFIGKFLEIVSQNKSSNILGVYELFIEVNGIIYASEKIKNELYEYEPLIRTVLSEK